MTDEMTSRDREQLIKVVKGRARQAVREATEARFGGSPDPPAAGPTTRPALRAGIGPVQLTI
jgi:hypothetical protein